MKVLIVEDNKVNQMVALKMFRHFGVETVLAENGDDAVKRFQQGDIDIVFMDCQMPVLDGYNAAKVMRDYEQRQSHKSVPIIAVTAHANTADKSRCLSVGMSDYLTKPLMLGDIERILTVWLPGFGMPKTGST